MGEELKCSNLHGINSCLKIEARIMAVYLSALPATRSDQAQSRAYKILLYIPELSPAECRPGFPFQQFVQKKTHRSAHITSSCYETRDAHTGNCRVYNHHLTRNQELKDSTLAPENQFLGVISHHNNQLII